MTSSTAPDPVAEILVEQLRWVRAAAMPLVRDTIDKALVKNVQREAFELSDGTRSGAEIAKAVGVSPQSISSWAANWRNLGIAYEVEARKSKHLISLEALGLPVEVG